MTSDQNRVTLKVDLELDDDGAAVIRRLVREEIARALAGVAHAADEADMPYETDREDSNIYTKIQETVTRAIRTLVQTGNACQHVHEPERAGQLTLWRCVACGELDEASRAVAGDPFTPLDPRCHHAFAKGEDDITRCQLCEGVKTDG